MNKCPKCKSTGKLPIEVHEAGKPSQITELECVYCDGKGKMTDAELKRHNELEAMWCSCGNPSGDAYPYDYGNCHGWNCADCHKVIQTG